MSVNATGHETKLCSLLNYFSRKSHCSSGRHTQWLTQGKTNNAAWQLPSPINPLIINWGSSQLSFCQHMDGTRTGWTGAALLCSPVGDSKGDTGALSHTPAAHKDGGKAHQKHSNPPCQGTFPSLFLLKLPSSIHRAAAPPGNALPHIFTCNTDTQSWIGFTIF